MTTPDAQLVLDLFATRTDHLVTVSPPLPDHEVDRLREADCTVEQLPTKTRVYRPIPASEASVIYKYPVHHGPINQLALPESCDILHVGIQHGLVTMWAKIPFSHTTQHRYFQVIGTGQRFPTQTRHVGTVQDGVYVWHLIEWPDVTQIECSP